MINLINRLKGKLTWVLLGNVTYALSQWVLITLLARVGTLEDLGMYSLALAINAPIILFFNFQLRVLLATEKDEGKDTVFQHYFTSRITHLAVAIIIVSITSVFFIVYTNKSMYELGILVLVATIKVFESLSDICLGYLQKKRKIDLIGKSQFFRAVMTVLVFGIIYTITKNLTISLLGLIIIMALRFYNYDLRNVRRLTSTQLVFSKEIWAITKVALPLGFVSLINSMNTNIPKYYLELFDATVSVGIYSALAYVLVAGGLIIEPISLLAAPKLTLLYYKGKAEFSKLIIKLCIVSTIVFAPIFIVVYFEGDVILSFLYGEHFKSYHLAFIIITIALLFSYFTTFLNLALVTARAVKIQPLINLITTIVAIVGSFLLIVKYGILGAALTLLLMRIVQTILSTMTLMYFLKRKN